jgi:protein tyrosine phosphatase
MKTIVLYTFDVIMLFHTSLPSRPSINTLYVLWYIAKELLSLEQKVESKILATYAVDCISFPCWTTHKSLLHCSSVGRNPIFLTCSYFCLLDASDHTCKPQTSPPYYLWWRILASLVSNMYHSLQQQRISSVRSFWTVSNLKISTSYHGKADSTGNKNIYLFSRLSS